MASPWQHDINLSISGDSAIAAAAAAASGYDVIHVQQNVIQ